MSAGRRPPPDAPGVYLLEPDGALTPVHAYQGGEYGPEEITGHFGLGHAARPGEPGQIVIELTARELRELKVNADAYSFDFEAPFIEMCLEMVRAGLAAGCDPCRFVGNF
jgi:hypothetical protein